MNYWQRLTALVALATGCTVAAFAFPIAGILAPAEAVLFFVGFSRLFKIGSFAATLVFAALVSCWPIVIFVAAAASSGTNWYEAIYWSVISIAGIAGLVVFFSLPLALALGSYLARRWLYTPNFAVNPDAPSARRLPQALGVMPADRSDADLWEEYRSVLSGHIQPDHDVVDTVNRLLRKNPWLTASGGVFQIPRSDLRISVESWELSRLWPLVHSDQITSQPPASLNGAVLVLGWGGVDYLIDGRRRVNSWHRDRVDEPRRTLVLQQINDA